MRCTLFCTSFAIILRYSSHWLLFKDKRASNRNIPTKNSVQLEKLTKIQNTRQEEREEKINGRRERKKKWNEEEEEKRRRRGERVAKEGPKGGGREYKQETVPGHPASRFLSPFAILWPIFLLFLLFFFFFFFLPLTLHFFLPLLLLFFFRPTLSFFLSLCSIFKLIN